MIWWFSGRTSGMMLGRAWRADLKNSLALKLGGPTLTSVIDVHMFSQHWYLFSMFTSFLDGTVQSRCCHLMIGVSSTHHATQNLSASSVHRRAFKVSGCRHLGSSQLPNADLMRINFDLWSSMTYHWQKRGIFFTENLLCIAGHAWIPRRIVTVSVRKKWEWHQWPADANSLIQTLSNLCLIVFVWSRQKFSCGQIFILLRARLRAPLQSSARDWNLQVSLTSFGAEQGLFGRRRSIPVHWLVNFTKTAQ